MTTWEYKVCAFLHGDIPYNEQQSMLGAIGNLGWELVSIATEQCRNGGIYNFFYFKRAIVHARPRPPVVVNMKSTKKRRGTATAAVNPS